MGALPKSYLSPSQIGMYLKCPYSYYERYVLGNIIRPNIKMIQGSAVHGATEHNDKQKIETRTDLRLNEVKDFAAAKFDELAQEVEETPQEKGKALDSSIRLTTLYMQEIAPTFQPLEVEEPIEVPFENVDYSLYIIPDRITECQTIRDIKTTGRTPGQDAINSIKELQLTAYSIGYEYKYGRKPRALGLDYLINTKTPKAESIPVLNANHERFLKIMQYVANGIKEEVFYPNFTSSQCAYCGYKSRCAKF